jgi:hypothetical protein
VLRFIPVDAAMTQPLIRNRMLQRCACTLIVVSLTYVQSLAKGGSYHTEDRYNPQHIESLPPEIRNAIYRKCSTPKALHPFASYSDNFKKILLHYEHFVCDGDGTYCTASGCLHQLYALVEGHYKLVRSYYAPTGE